MFPVKQLVFIDSSYNGLCHVTDLHDIILLLNLIKHDGDSPLMFNMIYVSRLFDTSVDYILVAVIRFYGTNVSLWRRQSTPQNLFNLEHTAIYSRTQAPVNDADFNRSTPSSL